MSEQNLPHGRYFEDLDVGYTLESVGRTITETDVMLFAGLSGDYNQLHTDAEFAKENPFGERIAHGLLGLSVATGLAARLGFVEGTAQAFTALEWKFHGPIRFGDTIRGRFTVARKRAVPGQGGGFVFFDVTILNQRDEVVQKGTWSILVKGRPSI